MKERILNDLKEEEQRQKYSTFVTTTQTQLL